MRSNTFVELEGRSQETARCAVSCRGARNYAAYLAEADRMDDLYAGERDCRPRQIRAHINGWINEG